MSHEVEASTDQCCKLYCAPIVLFPSPPPYSPVMDRHASTAGEPPKTSACSVPSTDQQVARRTRVIYFSNEFPNDDLERLLRRLHLLSKDKQYPILARFLDNATKAVREEVRNLTTELKDLVPAFESIMSFAGESELRKGRLRASIDGILHCFLQLATYIR